MRRAYRITAIVLILFFSLACAAVQPGGTTSEVTIKKDIVYGEVDGQTLTLDAYLPAGDESPYPAIVYIHGGGWSSGSKADFNEMAQFMAQLGYAGFSIEYRLMQPPEAGETGWRNHFPIPLEDAQRAMRWLRAHAGDYNIDPQRIAALGGSAGGHLAAMLGTVDAAAEDGTAADGDQSLAGYSSRATCVVDLYGPVDLTQPFPTQTSEGLNVQDLITAFTGGTLAEVPDVYAAASPMAHIDAETTPFLIFHGAQDEIVPVDQSRAFYQALKAKGVDAEYVEFADEGHGFAGKESQEVFAKRTMAFLEKCLKNHSE